MRKGSIFLILFLLAGWLKAQDGKLRKLDRAKWKELVEEINKKRYDPQERDNSNAESEFYDMEGGDEYGDGTGTSDRYDTDKGIYDGTSSSDRDFFNEQNDKPGPGSGNGNGGSELSPEYSDEPRNQNGSSSSGTSPGSNSDRPTYTPPKSSPPPTPTASRSSAGGDSTWLIIVMCIILGAAVVYMIIVSAGNKNKKVVPVAEDNESRMENMTITKSELELALEAALANKNYREAVRIYFIAVIKEMKERSWIKWEKKKTNYHYINEISGRTQQPDFITATRAFEIVWYGNRSLAENEYRQLEPHFKKLLSSINA